MDLGFDITQLPPCDPPAVGEMAPDFERPVVSASSWRDGTLTSLVADCRAVVLFHSMLGSYPATDVWSQVVDRDWSDRFDVSLIGVTLSTPYDARRFLEAHAPDGRIVSDPSNEVAAQYDLEHDLDDMAGVCEPRPAVFVVETDRTITYRWVAETWPEFPPYDEIEAALDAMDAVDD